MDMVERVARAITGELLKFGEGGLFDHQAVQLARAAIGAMREPTEAMHAAGDDWLDRMEAGGPEKMIEHAWRRMIDAALKEEENVQASD